MSSLAFFDEADDGVVVALAVERMKKWLMSKVLPGVAEVLAKPLWLVNMLMRLDFPTLLLPMKAYSALVSLGHWSTRGELNVNCALFISIFQIEN